MELTRRDALAALVATTAGVATVGEAADVITDGSSGDRPEVVSGLSAAAEVIFPSQVRATDEFLVTYVFGRESEVDEYVAEVADALDALTRYSRDTYGAGFEALSPSQRDSILRDAGVASVTPDPEGTEVERIRYYVVNELLCALYTTPKGARLLGNENPPGYPGGTEAYTEGPDR